ncbi:MAG: 3-phosphoshikimate 1-carboxyvinyltransferase, partial [Thermoanaerobacteraceae bacterium]|nr:3-phosphoshikimate 1-carboxyvinyltransferase [Thermoanaerobacteraceae bacterium]
MKCVKINPAELKGQIAVPPSKSISHRMLICASLAQGESIISNIALSDDITATLNGIKALGAKVSHVKANPDNETCDVIIKGRGFPEIVEHAIDCMESGSTLRFLIPIALLAGKEITFTGRGRLSQRPLDVYCRIFEKQGIYYYTNTGGLPITFSGRLKPGVFHVEGNVSSQFISGLLFSLPLLD